MAKYYLTKNAGKPVIAGGKRFTFEPAEFFEPSHTWWGTLLVDDVGDQKLLDAAVKARVIQEISESDYALYEVKKKKPVNSTNIVNLKQRHAPQLSAPSGKPVVVVEDPAPVERTAHDDSLDEVTKPTKPLRPPPTRRSRNRQ